MRGLALALACGAGAGALMWFVPRLAGRFTRYAIAGESMLPTLHPGDWVIVDRHAWAHGKPREGEIALARDPRDAGRTLVKRIRVREPGGDLWLLGDNARRSTDSRTLGAFPPEALLGRVRWRYWPPPLGEPAPGPRRAAAERA